MKTYHYNKKSFISTNNIQKKVIIKSLINLINPNNILNLDNKPKELIINLGPKVLTVLSSDNLKWDRRIKCQINPCNREPLQDSPEKVGIRIWVKAPLTNKEEKETQAPIGNNPPNNLIIIQITPMFGGNPYQPRFSRDAPELEFQKK